jgi:multidrug resistance protein
MLLAPLSEYFGRNPVYFCSWFILFIFQLPLALAPNIATVIVCRLIQGFGGSAPLTNTGGTVSDVWERNSSGPAMSIYGLSSTFGPPMALVISGYIAQEMGWRWLFWVYMAIFGGVWLIMMVSFSSRSYNMTNLTLSQGYSPRNPPQHHSREKSRSRTQTTQKGRTRKLSQTCI